MKVTNKSFVDVLIVLKMPAVGLATTSNIDCAHGIVVDQVVVLEGNAILHPYEAQIDAVYDHAARVNHPRSSWLDNRPQQNSRWLRSHQLLPFGVAVEIAFDSQLEHKVYRVD